MTALTAAVTLLPVLIAGRIPGTELLSPLAAVVLAGLVTTLLLNLFIVPALFLRWPAALPAEASEEPSAEPTLEAA
jgi:Cu/Ag efflux pump CusA